MIQRLRRAVFALGTAGTLAGGTMLAASSPVAADYGNSAIREIEISANAPGPTGGGAWLWIELSGASANATSGTGTYAGADCGHGGGAVSDKGDVTWTEGGGTITISGVHLNGLPPVLQPPAVTVPWPTGHYFYPAPGGIGAVFGLPFPGWSQVEVAP